MIMQSISIGNFDYSQNEKGEWIYKAKESKPLIKSNKPAKYREKPQYQLQETIEGKSKEKFNKIIGKTVLEVTKYIKDNI
jgi:hypothetical protein